MIWDSAPWKEGLIKDADQLDRWAARTSRIAQREILLERKIFIAAYAIRKLFEANKVSTSLVNRSVRCSSYRRLETTIAPWNWHRLDEHFDLGMPQWTTLSATALINQIIHSFIFMLCVDASDRVEGFYVTSGQGKKQKLFNVQLQDLCHLMREVGRDYPNSQTIEKLEDGSYRIVNS